MINRRLLTLLGLGAGVGALSPEVRAKVVPPAKPEPEPGVPIGMIVAVAPGGQLMANWLPCDGRALKCVSYPDLFDAIERTYGGDESTFHLPDLRTRTEPPPRYVTGRYMGAGTWETVPVYLTGRHLHPYGPQPVMTMEYVIRVR